VVGFDPVARTNLSLLAGHRVSPQLQAALQSEVEALPGVEAVPVFIVVLPGPCEVLVAAKVRFRRQIDHEPDQTVEAGHTPDTRSNRPLPPTTARNARSTAQDQFSAPTGRVGDEQLLAIVVQRHPDGDSPPFNPIRSWTTGRSPLNEIGVTELLYREPLVGHASAGFRDFPEHVSRCGARARSLFISWQRASRSEGEAAHYILHVRAFPTCARAATVVEGVQHRSTQRSRSRQCA
jgi:hypothetical protein